MIRNCDLVPLITLTIGMTFVGVMGVVLVGFLVALLGVVDGEPLAVVCTGFDVGVEGGVVHAGS